jgi:hypothetical protein
MIYLKEKTGAFDPETLHILGDAMDEAWRRLEGSVHLNGSADAARTVLAEHIIAILTLANRRFGSSTSFQAQAAHFCLSPDSGHAAYR